MHAIQEQPKSLLGCMHHGAHAYARHNIQEKKKKPDWMKLKVPGGDKYLEIKSKLRELKLTTVCEEAR